MTNAYALTKADRIKQETKLAHAETEKILIPQLKNIRDKKDYIHILKMFYGFFTPLQTVVESYIDKNDLADLYQRRKAAAIQKDLVQLKETAQPRVCMQLPVIHHPLQALGALYVIEGSTLGGPIIAKMLKSNPGLNADDSVLSYFNSYGENTLQMWSVFRQSLEEAIDTEDDLQMVIDSANDTFESLKTWMLNYN